MLQAISLWKDSGTKQLTRVFAQLLLGAYSLSGTAVIACTSIPQRPRAARARGWSPTTSLLRDFSALSGLTALPVLSFDREPADQRGLSSDDRRTNLARALQARFYPSPLVLIDDVITSGASLGEAERAITEAGGQVAFALTVVSAR